jgi:hypothetical protein
MYSGARTVERMIHTAKTAMPRRPVRPLPTASPKLALLKEVPSLMT